LSFLGCTGTAEVPTEDTGTSLDSCEQTAGGLGTATGTADCDESGVCEIPAGDAWIGDDDPAHPDRCPAHQVWLSAFAIDQTEVTLQAWQICVADGGCAAPEARCETESDVQDPEQVPVTCVNWEAAVGYCESVGGRLPTEAEWEKAARGTEGADWPWGPIPPNCNDANFRFVSSYCEFGVVEVGSRERGRSAFGLYDVSGNAWEWVADHYDAGRYADAPSSDPQGPESCRDDVDAEPETCVARVLRGGAFNTTEDTTRGATRSSGPPELQEDNIGFRCAYDR
jgi:formylglycine-generating enzyme required for sulfatase activity